MQGKYFCDGLRPEVEKREIEGEGKEEGGARVAQRPRFFGC